MEWIQKPNSWGGAIGIYIYIYTHNIDLFRQILNKYIYAELAIFSAYFGVGKYINV